MKPAGAQQARSFDEPLQESLDYLRELYRRDERPWVVAFSGGKDSTLLLQLVFEVLRENAEQGGKPVFVVASDTRVEAPPVADYLRDVLQHVEQAGQERRLPIHVRLVQPRPEESFWGKLLGTGYPSPTRWFRWCTNSMKIKPSKRTIGEITKEHGSVVLMLGTRIDESSARGARIKGREVTERGLNPHHEIADALVATPIAEWTTDQVWEYLFTHNPPPWGVRHDFLIGLYRQAAGGECPVVLDLSTPSCGGSRFGCWTCTVVKVDRSMQGFIDTGEEWLRPLGEFRDMLKAVRELPEWRMPRRRDDSDGLGPFRPEKRLALLEELLRTEQAVGRRLIDDEELAYIQAVWSAEFDLNESVVTIARSYGREISAMSAGRLPSVEQQVLDELIVDTDTDPVLIEKLLRLVLQDYADLSIWGNKANLRKAIQETFTAYLGNRGTEERG